MRNRGESLLKRKESVRRVGKKKSSLVTFFQESNALAASKRKMQNLKYRIKS